MVNNINREAQLHAKVDGKKVVISEASIKRDIRFEDEGEMANHTRIYVSPSHTKKIFGNIKRVEKGFSGRDTPLFPTMMVQAHEELGEDITILIETHHTPTINQPSTSKPQKKQNPRKPMKHDTEEIQPSDPIINVADEGLPKDTVPTHSNDPPLSRVNTLGSEEDRIKLKQLMELCTKLSNRVLDLETTKTAQAKEIDNLKKRVKRLEKERKSRTYGLKRLYKIGLSARVESSADKESLSEENASKQGRISNIDANQDIYLVNVHRDKDIFSVNDQDDTFVGNKMLQGIPTASYGDPPASLILYRTPWPIKGVLRIQQYLQNEHYALWEVIKFGDSYKALLEETCKGPTSESSARKKGRTEAILKTFGGNEATKKTKKNQLKLQYGNFKANGLKTLEQTFNRLQAIVSHLEFMDVEMKQDDLNQKFLTSLAPEWLMYTIVWRKKDDLDTMSLDDVYNHLKFYESEVQKKSESNSQYMAFISSSNTSSGKGEVHTASTQVSTASTDVAIASLSHDTICPKVEEPTSKALMAIDGIGWDWSYMANEEENHALVADDEVPTEFALMAKSRSSSDNEGNPQNNIDDKGYWDSGFSRHMTGNISYLFEYEPYDGGYVSFGHRGGKITSKGIIKTSKLEFENVYFVKELKYNLFYVS
nr:hypothetical protein [Tanacetum cinerariifolium]